MSSCGLLVCFQELTTKELERERERELENEEEERSL